MKRYLVEQSPVAFLWNIIDTQDNGKFGGYTDKDQAIAECNILNSKHARLTAFKKLLAAYDILSEWLIEQTPDNMAFEDVDAEIDSARALVEDAMDSLYYE